MKNIKKLLVCKELLNLNHQNRGKWQGTNRQIATVVEIQVPQFVSKKLICIQYDVSYKCTFRATWQIEVQGIFELLN